MLVIITEAGAPLLTSEALIRSQPRTPEQALREDGVLLVDRGRWLAPPQFLGEEGRARFRRGLRGIQVETHEGHRVETAGFQVRFDKNDGYEEIAGTYQDAWIRANTLYIIDAPGEEPQPLAEYRVGEWVRLDTGTRWTGWVIESLPPQDAEVAMPPASPATLQRTLDPELVSGVTGA